MYSKFIEKTLQDFLVKMNEPLLTPEELDEIRRDRSLPSRMKYRVATVKWFARSYALFPLSILHTMAFVACGGIARIEERTARELVARLQSSTPQVILDKFLRETLAVDHVHEDVRRVYESIRWELSCAPTILSYVPSIITYYVVQEVVGPMIYWPLRLLQRPIVWMLEHLR